MACIFLEFFIWWKVLRRIFWSQTCLLSSVEWLYFSYRNEVLWFAYFVLNFPSVSPTWLFSSLLSSLATIARYTIPSLRHFPRTGQALGWLQLHAWAVAEEDRDSFLNMDWFFAVISFSILGSSYNLTVVPTENFVQRMGLGEGFFECFQEGMADDGGHIRTVRGIEP